MKADLYTAQARTAGAGGMAHRTAAGFVVVTSSDGAAMIALIETRQNESDLIDHVVATAQTDGPEAFAMLFTAGGELYLIASGGAAVTINSVSTQLSLNAMPGQVLVHPVAAGINESAASIRLRVDGLGDPGVQASPPTELQAGTVDAEWVEVAIGGAPFPAVATTPAADEQAPQPPEADPTDTGTKDADTEHTSTEHTSSEDAQVGDPADALVEEPTVAEATPDETPVEDVTAEDEDVAADEPAADESAADETPANEPAAEEDSAELAAAELAAAEQAAAELAAAEEAPPVEVPDVAAASESDIPLVEAVASPTAAEPAPAASISPVPAKTVGPIMVLGVACSQGHHNHPDAVYCSQCGTKMGVHHTTVLLNGPRPPLGVLVVDDGTTYSLSEDLVIGREPTSHDDVVAGFASPMILADETLALSRQHARIALDEWSVSVLDLNSSNGTHLSRAGQSDSWELIPPATPTSLEPGDRIRVGGRIIQVELHHVR